VLLQLAREGLKPSLCFSDDDPYLFHFKDVFRIAYKRE